MIIPKSIASLAMAAAEQEARNNGWNVTIVISDSGGIPIMIHRMDGAFAASFEIAVGKAKTAALFAKPTFLLEDATNVKPIVGDATGGGASARTSMLSAPFILMGGGVPLLTSLSNNNINIALGSVGVSGAKPDQDEQVANAAISVLKQNLVPFQSKL